MSEPAVIRFPCPGCKFSLSAPVEKAGAKSCCPKCRQPVVVPAPLVPVLDALSAEPVLDALPAAPRRDRSGKYYLMDCASCGRPLRVPTYEKGRIVRCPSCRYFYKAPGRRRRGDDDGLPVSLRVSAHVLMWPQRCVCCLDYHDVAATAAHTRVDWARVACALDSARRGWYGYGALWAEGSVQEKAWEIPYCWECLDHIQRRTDRCKKTCCNLDPAVIYAGWHGSFHAFRFYNWQYANAFIYSNSDKLIG